MEGGQHGKHRRPDKAPSRDRGGAFLANGFHAGPRCVPPRWGTLLASGRGTAVLHGFAALDPVHDGRDDGPRGAGD